MIPCSDYSVINYGEIGETRRCISRFKHGRNATFEVFFGTRPMLIRWRRRRKVSKQSPVPMYITIHNLLLWSWTRRVFTRFHEVMGKTKGITTLGFDIRCLLKLRCPQKKWWPGKFPMSLCIRHCQISENEFVSFKLYRIVEI